MADEKIMIVDDNKAFLEELQETLYLCGYDVRIVSDSTKALKIARKIRPNAILLDLRMNGASGFHVAEELKHNKETSGIPIIAMSGYFPIENKSVLLDFSNMDGRIEKPFGISELITQIETVLNRRKRNN